MNADGGASGYLEICQMTEEGAVWRENFFLLNNQQVKTVPLILQYVFPPFAVSACIQLTRLLSY